MKQGKTSSYSALGFTRHLIGDIEGAIDFYHQALSRKPDDPFSNEMLNRALEEALDDMGSLSIASNTNSASYAVDAPPMTPKDNSCMSIGSTTLSSIKYQDGNNILTTSNGRSFFSPGDNDVNMSMT